MTNFETGRAPVGTTPPSHSAEEVDSPLPPPPSPGAGRPWQAAGPPPCTKSGIPTLAIVLILIGTVLVALCCGITTVGAVLGDDDPEQTSPTAAAQEVESPTPSPDLTEEPTPDPTEEPTSGPLDRLPDYWAAYGCEDFTCILDAGEPGMRPWWVRSIEEHSTYAAVR